MYLSIGVLLYGGGALLLRLRGRRGPTLPWQVVPGGFRAEPRRGVRTVLGALLLLGTA